MASSGALIPWIVRLPRRISAGSETWYDGSVQTPTDFGPMVSISELIDPAAKNRQLRALAFFQASLVSHSTSAIDCLVPIVLLALKSKDRSQFDVEEVVQAVRTMFPQLALPLYMVNEIIPKLVSRDALRHDSRTRMYVVDLSAVQRRLDETPVNFDPESISALEESLSNFAKNREVHEPFGSPTWEQALIHFFSSEIEEAPRDTKTIQGALISHPRQLDNTLIAAFLGHAEREGPHIFESAVRLFYAVATYNFFRDLERTGNKEDYKGLLVFYDATVLMRLLGTSGKLLRVATLQMHEALQSLGCRIYYFGHTYQETQSNLERVVQNYRERGSVYQETNEALKSSEITIGRIATLSKTIDSELGRLGITQHSASYQKTRGSDQHQIDEVAFVSELDIGSPYYDELTRSRDAQSLALVMRLRAGSSTRDVGKSRYIFVTHNASFAGVSKRFCRRQGIIPDRTIPPVITLGQMTTLSWLASEKPYREDEVTKELLANCYRAVLPSERWEEEFWSALDSLKNQEDAGRVLQEAIYVDSARQIALEQSFGHPALVKKVVDLELLRRVEEDRTSEITRVTQDAREEAHADLQRSMRANAERYAEKIASIAIKWVKLALCSCCVLLFLLSLNLEEIRNTIWLYPSLLIAGFLGIVPALDFFGFPLSRNFLDPLKNLLKRAILRARPYHLNDYEQTACKESAQESSTQDTPGRPR
jgi:hypothetical protein